jgi:hypothetical protein
LSATLSALLIQTRTRLNFRLLSGFTAGWDQKCFTSPDSPPMQPVFVLSNPCM